MSDIINFKKSRGIHQGLITCSAGLKEYIGPTGYEKFFYITPEEVTVPHIDLFDDNRYNTKIFLSGITEDVDITIYNNNVIDSIKQYYLKHPTRDGIQYLIYDNEDPTDPNAYTTIVPGVIYSDSGIILGYLHSYVANDYFKIYMELPYGSDYGSYSITGDRISCTRDGNLVTISISGSTTATINDGTNSASFNLFVKNPESDFNQTVRVKNVNIFGDYLIAAGEVNSILDIERIFSTLVMIDSKYYCERFMSIKLFSFAEYDIDIAPGIYKVPAALVPTENGKVFMTDVIGLSARNITE